MIFSLRNYHPRVLDVVYEHLIHNEQVDFLLGPWNRLAIAAQLAEQNEIPIINIADFSFGSWFFFLHLTDIFALLTRYYTLSGGVNRNGTFGGWLFSAVPNPDTIFSSCFNVLAKLNASTVSAVFGERTTTAGFPFLNSLFATRAGMHMLAHAEKMHLINQWTGLSVLDPTYVVKDDLSNASQVMSLMQERESDILVGMQSFAYMQFQSRLEAHLSKKTTLQVPCSSLPTARSSWKRCATISSSRRRSSSPLALVRGTTV